MSSHVTAQSVTCYIFYVTTRLLFTHTRMVDKCLDTESAENFYVLSRLRKLLFPKTDLLGLPSHTATSVKNVFEMDLKKRWI